MFLFVWVCLVIMMFMDWWVGDCLPTTSKTTCLFGDDIVVKTWNPGSGSVSDELDGLAWEGMTRRRRSGRTRTRGDD